ncbi:MAG: tRNA(5-methylaminomethyl-2-thiouridylate) methyltransferase, partial [Desulfovibrionaceae bacterium]
MSDTYDGLALFSGGLDSILACRVLADQGRRILGLHFTSPFFGHPDRLDFWRAEYGVEAVCVDIADEFTALLTAGPPDGFGKDLNPCVDCKILMLRRARALMPRYGARFLISGEVLGQRPMSQRRDTLGRIRIRAGVDDVLVRPLSAHKLPETAPERDGRVDRARLLGLWGRGRNEQMRLAREVYGFSKFPQPGGGCALTDGPQVARFWNVLDRAAA